jgi:hypothetical protein
MPDDYLQWQISPLQDGHRWPAREVAKYYFIFNYAFQNTSSRWIYRGFDDALIKFDILLDYIRELERRYDPLEDVVVRGDCIVNGPIYPSGGPGSIFSRAAVQKLASYGNFSIWEIPYGVDDQKFALVLLEAGIDPGGTASSAFFEYFDEIDNWTNSTVKEICPLVESLGNLGCHKFVAPLNQIVFFHGGKYPFEQRFERVKKIWSAQSWVYFHSDGGYQVRLCRYFGPKLFQGKFLQP